MSSDIILALFGAGFNAGNDLVYRKASIINRNGSLFHFYFLSSASATIIAMLFLLIKPDGVSILNFGTINLFYGIILGMLSFITYILYLSSFSGENTSICVTIYRMNMIPAIVLAIVFLGETISLRRGAAILCCIISVSLLGSWNSGKLKDNRHIIFSIGACISGGALSFVNKLAITHGGNSFRLLFIRFVIVTLLTGILIFIRKPVKFESKNIKFAVFSGLFLMLAIYFVLEAFKTGDLTLVLPVTQLSFAVVAIISWIFFDEKMNARKITGIALALGSIMLIS